MPSICSDGVGLEGLRLILGGEGDDAQRQAQGCKDRGGTDYRPCSLANDAPFNCRPAKVSALTATLRRDLAEVHVSPRRDFPANIDEGKAIVAMKIKQVKAGQRLQFADLTASGSHRNARCVQDERNGMTSLDV